MRIRYYEYVYYIIYLLITSRRDIIQSQFNKDYYFR